MYKKHISACPRALKTFVIYLKQILYFDQNISLLVFEWKAKIQILLLLLNGKVHDFVYINGTLVGTFMAESDLCYNAHICLCV